MNKEEDKKMKLITVRIPQTYIDKLDEMDLNRPHRPRCLTRLLIEDCLRKEEETSMKK